MVTPLLIALVAIELSDIVFAVDSVPAAIAISPSRFVVYSSNALAVLGLRSLYLLLDDLIGELKNTASLRSRRRAGILGREARDRTMNKSVTGGLHRHHPALHRREDLAQRASAPPAASRGKQRRGAGGAGACIVRA